MTHPAAQDATGGRRTEQEAPVAAAEGARWFGHRQGHRLQPEPLGCADASVTTGRGTWFSRGRCAGSCRSMLAPFAASVFGTALGRPTFIQWCAFDERDLRVIQLLAGASVLSSACTQQLQRQLVDHQLEERHLGVDAPRRRAIALRRCGACCSQSAQRSTVPSRRAPCHWGRTGGMFVQWLRPRVRADAFAPTCASRCPQAASAAALTSTTPCLMWAAAR
jgi:hypothetical protein